MKDGNLDYDLQGSEPTGIDWVEKKIESIIASSLSSLFNNKFILGNLSREHGFSFPRVFCFFWNIFTNFAQKRFLESKTFFLFSETF